MRHAAFLVSLCVLSCVLDPRSGTSVPAGATSVTFQGLAAAGGSVAVGVEAEASPGVWVALGSAPVGSDGRWTATVPVPETSWWHEPCGAARFRFRSTDGSTLRGIDDACLRAAGPAPTLQQFTACLVPVVELSRGQVHAGDLAITGQAQADAVACVTEVQGNLTVDAGAVPGLPGWHAGLAFSLPRLERVTGDATIDGDRTESLSLPRLAAVGGDLRLQSWQFLAGDFPPGGGAPTGVHEGVNHWVLPLLATVGGSVSLTASVVPGGISGSASTHNDFGLPALTAVGADVAVHNTGFPTAIDGLPALVTIPRDLVFDWGVTDLDSIALLPALSTVGRDAAFALPPNSRTALGALGTVGRDVHLAAAPNASDARLGPHFLPALRTVDGELEGTSVSAGTFCGAGVLASLERVDGTLRFTGGRPDVALGVTGPSHLVLGGLELSATSSAHVPLHDDAQVLGSGPVAFTGNAGLCPCQLSALATALGAGGWTGTLVASGNGASATCSPCPSATCP
jgi:hypothetical protein